MAHSERPPSVVLLGRVGESSLADEHYPFGKPEEHSLLPGGIAQHGLLREVSVLDDYWEPHSPVRTVVGELVHLAKDCGDCEARAELARRFAALAERVRAGSSGEPLVVPVPASLGAGTPTSGQQHLAGVLASALADAGAGECALGLVSATREVPKLRSLAPALRPAAAARAGYRANECLAGRDVVIVDDVVLTGSTLNAVASCLKEAGAGVIVAAAAARTRLDRPEAPLER